MNELDGVPRDPRILLWDIETSEMIVTSFQLFEANINYTDILQDWYMFCAAWKWLGKPKIYSSSITDFGSFEPFTSPVRYPTLDEGVVTELHKVLSSADALIGHNSDRFDLKKFNARALYFGLTPIPPLIQIDTLKIARKHFKLTSNRLDYLGDYLGAGKKLDNEKGLWKRCLYGDIDSLKKMRTYNKRDVTLLEDVYLKLQPYEPSKINLNLFKYTDNHCPSCHSVSGQRRGFNRSRTAKKQRFQCMDCGHWWSKPTNGIGR